MVVCTKHQGGKRMPSRGKPTLSDVARAAGVSTAAVSMILRGTPGVSFSEETVRRVTEAASTLGYRRPTPSSPYDRPVIAVFLPLVTGSYYTFITQAITQQANRHGYDTIVLETHRNLERELRLMHALPRIGVSGVIFTAPPMNAEAAVSMAQTIPTVIINNERDGTPLDTIVIDDLRVGELVADHLLGLGHRTVAFVEISRQWQGISISQRLVGAKARFASCPGAELLVYSRRAPDTLRPGSFIETREQAREIAAECLENERITAFICISDYAAYGVMDELAARGKRIPQDYSVCACDNLFASSLAGVSLTTVDRHPVEIGVKSFELLLQRLIHPSSGEQLPPHITRVEYLSTLIVRDSSGIPRRV